MLAGRSRKGHGTWWHHGGRDWLALSFSAFYRRGKGTAHLLRCGIVPREGRSCPVVQRHRLRAKKGARRTTRLLRTVFSSNMGDNAPWDGGDAPGRPAG